MKYFTISNSPIGRILMMSDGENLNALEAIGRRNIALNGLAENKEEIHILPASYGIEEGLQMSGTKILMKAGKQMASVKETLRKSKGQFRMVENCGMDGERIYTDPEEVPEKTSYYSLIIIKEGS